MQKCNFKNLPHQECQFQIHSNIPNICDSIGESNCIESEIRDLQLPFVHQFQNIPSSNTV
jgi:hypothetical protein